MAVENRFRFSLDIKFKTNYTATVTANDHNIFEIELRDARKKIELSSGYVYHFITKTKENAYIREASLNNAGYIEVDFGYSETQLDGIVDCVLQVYDVEMNRISTSDFKVNVVSDKASNDNIPADDRNVVILNESMLNKALVTKKEEVTTTEGKYWSTSKEDVFVTLDESNKKLVTMPLDTNKRILLLGSSSTEGIGVSDLSNFYGKRLEKRLSSRGYEVIYRGVSSDNTSNVINRFFKDVVSANPDFVFIALTIGNEGIYNASDKVSVYKQFRDNILKLIHLIKKFGAIPIVFTQAPTQLFTLEIYDYSKKMDEEIEASGVICIDWGGVVDDLSGQPIVGSMADALHYNDAAHKEICNAIPPTLFEKISIQTSGFLTSPKGHIRFGEPLTYTPIFFIPTDEITTFTVFLRFKIPSVDGFMGLISLNSLDRVFMSADGSISFTGSQVTDIPVDNSKSFADNTWFSIALSYSALSNQLRVYINGVYKGSITTSIIPSKITLGGRDNSPYTLKNSEIKDFILYRTRLKDYQIKQLHEGSVSQTSLEIFSPLNDKVIFPNGNIINLAATTTNLVVNVGEKSISPASDD